jgi:hypothetical protein
MKTQRHRITYTDDDELEAVTLAQFGQSTEHIQRETGLTQCQIGYRLTKAKKGEGLPAGQGYRTQWRNGTSPLYKQIARQFKSTQKRRNRKVLPPKFVKQPAW